MEIVDVSEKTLSRRSQHCFVNEANSKSAGPKDIQVTEKDKKTVDGEVEMESVSNRKGEPMEIDKMQIEDEFDNKIVKIDMTTESSFDQQPDRGSGLRKHLPMGSMAPVCGLPNLGNQCYMNASLQCLSHTHLLRDIFWKPKCIKKKFPTDDLSLYSNVTFIPIQTDRKYGKTQKLVEAFKTLQRSMWKDQWSIVNSLRDIKARVASLDSRFAGYSQEDAQEFLMCLLDGLHEGMNRVKKKKYVSMSIENVESWTDEEMADELWRRHLIRNKSMIVELFQGQIKSVLKCLNCTEEVKTFEPIMQLTLPVPPEDTFNPPSHYLGGYQQLTLYQCLNYYTKQRTLTGFCEHCLTNTDNKQKFDIWKLPPILVIHLKRFSVSIRNGHKKVTRNVLYPSARLDLSKYVIGCHPGNAIYELYGVINHYGMLYAGHYTAFVKESDDWYCCDDSSCYEVPPRDVYENSSAYVLFYKREQRRRRPSI